MSLKDYIPKSIKSNLKRILKPSANSARQEVARMYCPVCDSKIVAFQPLSPMYEENKKKYGWPYNYDDAETINPQQYQCPHCGASDRDRLYALYLRSKLPHTHAAKIPFLIEFAPSVALQKLIKRYKVDYRTADLYMQGVDDTLDIMDMHIYPENYCDIFICSHILEHVADDCKALQELYRILKPGGWGILMVPINLKIKDIQEDPTVTDIGERWRRFGQDDHIRLYSKAGFIQRVKDAGFHLKQLDKNFFGVEEFARCGITERSVLYIGEKHD